MELIRTVDWFRRFMVARCMLLLVEFTLAFASIHASVIHLVGAQALSLFVAASGVGVILSGPVFGRLTDRHADRVIIVVGILTLASGAVAVSTQEVAFLGNIYVHAATFALLSLARQGAVQARVNYLSRKAPDDERALYISISNSLVGTLGIALAALLGWIAHMHHIVVPIIVRCISIIGIDPRGEPRSA